MLKKVRQEWLQYYRDQGDETKLPVKRLTILDCYLGCSQNYEGDQFTAFVEDMPSRFATPTDTNLLTWWVNVGPPQLRQMAFDLLPVPCTSCEIKRVFSSAKRLITPQARPMTDKTIEIR
jgi:hypothetical protein